MAYQCKSIYWLQKLETSTIIYKSGRGAQDRDRITYVQRQSKKQLRPVVQRVDNSNQLVNRYAAEKCEQFTIVKLRLEQLLRIFCALQTSQVLHISMNAQLTCHNNFNLVVKMLSIFPLLRFCTLVILVQENISLRYKRSCLRLVKKPTGEIMRGNKLYLLIDYKILEGFGSCRHERAQ